MVTIVVIVIGLAAALLLLTAGYLFGVARGRSARAELRTQAEALAAELTRWRARAADDRHADDNLRAAIQNLLTPLIQRQRVAFDLAHLDGVGGQQRDLTSLLDRIAEKGNLTAVLLSDEQGLPLAASSGARELDRLGATSSLMLLLADRMSRDGAAEPRSLMVHDASNHITLSRLFRVSRQRLSLTAVSVGDQLSPSALDPALARVEAALLQQARSAPAPARSPRP